MSELTNRIDTLLSEKNKRRADLSRETGIAVTTIRSWIKGSVPSAEAAYKIAKYFNVTLEWLLTGEGESPEAKPTTEEFSDTEKELIYIFRNLDDRDKNAVMSLAKTLEEQYSSTTAKNTTAG